MKDHYYILDGAYNPVSVRSVLEWAEWIEDDNHRQVARTNVAPGIDVSTVFLGINHNFGEGAPILFETMVFGGALDEEQERYYTWDEARRGHAAIVKRVKQALDTKSE